MEDESNSEEVDDEQVARSSRVTNVKLVCKQSVTLNKFLELELAFSST